DRLDEGFERVLDALLACRGRVVASGMGKAGQIAHKVSTTLASTGTPSFYMHPAEALHGDLGMLHADDILLMFSNSGESREVTELLPFVRMIGARVIAITGNPRSTLAAHSELVLSIGNLGEACPLGLAPSATTTAMLALGDALALCLMKRREFKVDDYARLHPGGALGMKTLPVECVMRVNEAVAKVSPQTSVHDTLFEITRARAGAAMIVDDLGKVLGVFTDGDLRRGIEQDDGFLNRKIGEVMTQPFICVEKGQRFSDVLDVLKEKRIGEAPVVDEEGRLLGVVDLKGLVATIPFS
ncbi:MAG: KpsF/GutQ family sugar-phosphate isomerase, partial [Candidatus Hydrogenedentes bacterium]|nr:KpsF/GutQ family sugar-phosphate isomerase [Candidatus Hydrogenedentota bacterium]